MAMATEMTGTASRTPNTAASIGSMMMAVPMPTTPPMTAAMNAAMPMPAPSSGSTTHPLRE